MTGLFASNLMLCASPLLGRAGRPDRPYEAESLVSHSFSDALPARSYFPAVSGMLLPDTARENSRARACNTLPASCRAYCPVRVMSNRGYF